MENFKREAELASLKKGESQDNLAEGYLDGRAWEDIPTEELNIIVTMNKLFPGNPYSKKAEEVLAERKTTGGAGRNPLDDGSVKGLIVSNDKYLDIGRHVKIQRTLNGVREWVDRDNEGTFNPWRSGQSFASEFIYTENENDNFSNERWKKSESDADSIVALCRRKFRKEEIILFTHYNNYIIGGMVFLEDRICTFNEKQLEYVIPYAEMEEIDFTDDSVTIRVLSDGEEENVSIYCGDKEKYTQGVYSLLMDIKDRL